MPNEGCLDSINGWRKMSSTSANKIINQNNKSHCVWSQSSPLRILIKKGCHPFPSLCDIWIKTTVCITAKFSTETWTHEDVWGKASLLPVMYKLWAVIERCSLWICRVLKGLNYRVSQERSEAKIRWESLKLTSLFISAKLGTTDNI